MLARTLKSSRHAALRRAVSAPEKSAVRVACLAGSHDQIRMESLSRNAAILAAFAIITIAPSLSYSAETDLKDIKSEITKRHDEAVKRLQDWIGQVSIAAENRGYPEGAEYMAKLARDAGFQQATVINTDGKPGVFATLDAGAPKTIGLYFMYDVKQFDPAEWTSPPTEARIVDKPPLGKVIVGRGAVNQKGPEAAFLAALARDSRRGEKDAGQPCDGGGRRGGDRFAAHSTTR